MRRTPILAAFGMATVLAAGLVEREYVAPVRDEPPEPPPPAPKALPQPAGPTAADLFRQRMAAQRRARKTARQAKGFASGTQDGSSQKKAQPDVD